MLKKKKLKKVEVVQLMRKRRRSAHLSEQQIECRCHAPSGLPHGISFQKKTLYGNEWRDKCFCFFISRWNCVMKKKIFVFLHLQSYKVVFFFPKGAWLRHSMDDNETGSFKVFEYGRYDGLLTGKLANKVISNRQRAQNDLGPIN